MRIVKNILFIFSIILGIIGISGLSYAYYSGVMDNLVFFVICQIISIIFSWCFVFIEYWEKGYFKRRKKNE